MERKRVSAAGSGGPAVFGAVRSRFPAAVPCGPEVFGEGMFRFRGFRRSVQIRMVIGLRLRPAGLA